VKAEGGIRQRILDTAFAIVESEGVRAMTQPRIARLAGLRQSHLTYYFPRKADLLVALLQHSHERAEHHGPADDPDAVLAMLRNLMFDRTRTRFFLNVMLEAGEDAEFRPVLREHLDGLGNAVAPAFGRQADDPAVASFIDRLRGIGLRLLAGDEDVEALAAESGLRLARLRKPRGRAVQAAGVGRAS